MKFFVKSKFEWIICFIISIHVIHLFHLFNHARIIIVIPLCQVDSLLHFLKSFLEHLSKFSRHFLNFFLQVKNLCLFGLQFFVLFLLCCSYGLIILLQLFFPLANLFNQHSQLIIILLLHLLILMSHSCCYCYHFLSFCFEISL